MPRHGEHVESDRAVGQQRRRVLDLLRAADNPVDARQIAEALQIHVTTARFHLSTLESQGVIRRGDTDSGAGRVGRPRLTYETVPRLDYADVVALFAAHLGGTPEEREARALRIGADLAHQVRVTRRRGETSVADLVLATLGELGFEARSVLTSFGEVSVEICTCPLAEVAVGSPEVVRGIQQGLMQEVIDLNAEAIGGRYEVSVRPDARHGSCEVSLQLQPVAN
ncbi:MULTISPECIES: helix-turn-helix transcriptional regulator [Mycobacterium]|uniref:ArsR family transcriptional regulator n=1 Tax=Mycobacterium syngnathidarum TaxID=1908205 RepID=A0A1S1K7P7_9MYCO|nr:MULTISPECIES: helix-turn-helix domain-containing protein [Mycobacterium]MCG7609778.1 helix-turn-helix domain-containing protein [Mycobacterium sp. CnD-18-1]OHU01461.1 ArsR family transcriptional regulator [Mycobacterium syngnathidarum]OLT95622.1 ArsR family transcriptional regulator [Mycobacterium syngnathidarum]